LALSGFAMFRWWDLVCRHGSGKTIGDGKAIGEGEVIGGGKAIGGGEVIDGDETIGGDETASGHVTMLVVDTLSDILFLQVNRCSD
jgi:hypothetical protein